MITHFAKVGNIWTPAVVLRRAMRFAEGKTYYRQNDGLLQYEVLLWDQRFSLSLVSFLSLLLAIKEKEMNILIILFMYIKTRMLLHPCFCGKIFLLFNYSFVYSASITSSSLFEEDEFSVEAFSVFALCALAPSFWTAS